MSGLFSEPSVKKILEVGEIEEQLEKKGKNINKISFLKGFLDDDYKDKRADIVRLLGPLLIHKDNSVENYSLTYDSFGEGVEPIYVWMFKKVPKNLRLLFLLVIMGRWVSVLV